MAENVEKLVVKVTATYKGAVGFGEIFDCEILDVSVGSLNEPRFNLSILAGDKKNIDFINDHQQPAEIEIGFKINQKNEPYSMAPISGFVDKSRTSWVIEFMRTVQK